MIVCTVLGMTIEQLAYKPLRAATSLAVLITAIGVSYFLQNAALLLWGSSPVVFPNFVQVGAAARRVLPSSAASCVSRIVALVTIVSCASSS